ncbi:MAG: DUF1937 family protein [Proteobacteria bacterium]|nr:DUF1937 family protein [Pseudomonadota bacterium]
MSFYYIAHPYRHKDKSVEDDRIKKVAETAGSLVLYGKKSNSDIKVLAPVLHNSVIHRINNFNHEEVSYIFNNFDFHFLKSAKAMIVITLPGWEESTGVRAEINFCDKNNIPVFYLGYEDRDDEKKLKSIFEK